MPEIDRRFTTMSLEHDSTHDAVLLAANSMILNGREDYEQGDYMVSIAKGVIDNDLDLKAEILAAYDNLDIINIKNNLEQSYANVGIEINTPPFWRLIAPNYYTDLLEGNPTVEGSFNPYDGGSCSFDQSTFNTFAIPHVFESWIETSKFIALNLAGDVSIWTKVFDSYYRPGAKLLDIEQLRELLLDGPVNLPYNGKLGDHNLTAGTDYYIVVRRDTGWRLTTGCDGGFLPFGRKLASDDEGASWIGHDNNTSWFRKSGLKMFGVSI